MTNQTPSNQVRWAVITKMGRVVVEAETADAAREKVERRGYFVLELNLDNSRQAVSFWALRVVLCRNVENHVSPT